MDYIVSTDPIKRVRREPGYGGVALKKLLGKIKENNGKIYFAEIDTKIVGYIAGYVGKQSEEKLLEVIPSKTGYIEDLYVDQDFRGKKVGTALMQKIEEYFKNLECDSLWIEVFAPNQKAHSYYKKLGFADREFGMHKKLD